MVEDNNSRKIVELSIDDILPNRFQPRIKFDDSAIFELSESIKIHGVFQPIIVRPIGDKYEIIAGERRYKASVLANRKTVPAIIMNLGDKDTIEIALIENVQRANLTPIEEAISYKKILDMGYITQEQLANKLGKSQSAVANKLRLLNLDEDVQEALLENKISERHARSILKLKDFNKQKIILKRIINERLTVRKTDEEIGKMMNNEQPINNGPINIDIQEPTSIPEVVTEDNNMTNTSMQSSPFFNNNPFGQNVDTSTVLNSNPQPEVPSNIEAPTQINVDNIMTGAKEINVEKPLAPMDQILKEDSTIQKEKETKEDNQPKNIVQGKFFTFTSNDAVTEEKNSEESNNFNFDNLYNNVQPVSNNSNSNLNDPSSINNKIEQNSSSSIGFGDSSKNDDEQGNNQFANFFNNVIESNNDEDVQIKEEPQTDQNNPSSLLNNNFGTTTNNNDNFVDTPFGFTPATDVPETNESFNNDVKVEENENKGISQFEGIPEYQKIETIDPQVKLQKNIMEAVNIIRKSIEEAKNNGFVIDSDEIDLENQYQIIVKIDK